MSLQDVVFGFKYRDIPMTLTLLSDTSAIFTDKDRAKWTAKFGRADASKPWMLQELTVHEIAGFPYERYTGLHPEIVDVAIRALTGLAAIQEEFIVRSPAPDKGA